MITASFFPDALEAARQLATDLHADIQLARTREEHIRITARAHSASALYYLLLNASTATD